MEHRDVSVAERQVTKLDCAQNLRDRRGGYMLVGDRRLRVEDVQHALPGRQAPLEEIRHPAKRDHRPAEHHQVGVEGDQLADGHALATTSRLPIQNTSSAPTHQQTHAGERHALQPESIPGCWRRIPHWRAGSARSRMLPVHRHEQPGTPARVSCVTALIVGELFLDLLEPMVDRRAKVTDHNDTNGSGTALKPSAMD